MRVVVVAEAGVLQGSSNAFARRYAAVLKILGEDHDLALVHLRLDPPVFDTHAIAPPYESAVFEIEIPRRPHSRAERLIHIARLTRDGLSLEPWERELDGVLKGWRPDVVIAIAWHCRYAFRSLPGRFPTVSFLEEDFSIHPEEQRTTPWGRWLARVEDWSERRPLRRSRCVVVIAEPEVEWARKAFSPAPVLVVPHTIDLNDWAAQPSSLPDLGPRAVFVTGYLDHLRNARGLRAIIDALRGLDVPGKPQLVVASITGLHPILKEVSDQFRFLGGVDDVRPYYKAADATLVPSFKVSGSKTTILQGWAARCPVVTSSVAAESVGWTDGFELLAGESPADVARHLCEVVASPALQSTLAQNGERALSQRFSSERVRQSIEEALRAASESSGAYTVESER
jgi:glycosyltransferase involved in cell wall biosynthesis